MDTLERTFFEDPTYVYLLLGLAWAAAFFLWRARRTKAWAAALAVIPLLAGAVLVVERLIVTDREMILSASREIAADLGEKRFAAVEKYLANDFNGAWATKAQAVEAGKEALGANAIQSVTLRSPRVEINGRLAVMNVVTIVESATGYRASLAWKIYWTKLPEGWRITSADKPEMVVSL